MSALELSHCVWSVHAAHAYAHFYKWSMEPKIKLLKEQREKGAKKEAEKDGTKRSVEEEEAK